MWRTALIRADRPGGARAPRLPLVLASALLAGCGSNPSTPPVPSPSPTPSVGPVAGVYTLQLVPAAGCPLPGGTLSFPVEATQAPARYPGVQAVLVGDRSAVEAELLNRPGSVRGGVGTRGDGALASEGVRVWVRGVAEGNVTRAGDGRGEVTAGVLLGYLALGHADGAEGSLGSCLAVNHAFSLRAR